MQRYLYESFCLQTLVNFLSDFNTGRPWVYLSPTTHALLNHSHIIIEENDCRGLLKFSESPLEYNNKFLRFYRSSLSRKSSYETNISDCLQRLWLKSDPNIRSSVPLPSKRATSETEAEIGPKTKEQYYRQLFTICYDN